LLGNLGHNETYILYFLSPSLFKKRKRFRATAASKYFPVNDFLVGYFSSLWVLFRSMQRKKEKKTMQQYKGEDYRVSASLRQ